MYFLLYLLVGICAGTLSGLLGIGGGLVVVPALVFIFHHHAIVPAVNIFHVAVATSLAIMIITTSSSIAAHILHKTVIWQLILKLLPGFIVGSMLGAAITSFLPGHVLKIIFAVFLFITAVRMFMTIQMPVERQLPANTVLGLFSCVAGMLSPLLGIGLGSMGVPFLRRYNVPMQQASAITVTCTMPMALCGSVSFLLADFYRPIHGIHLMGYVYWPAFLLIGSCSLIFAPIGVRLANRMNKKLLQRVFAVFLFVVCFSLIVA
ncbi:MAG: sulfite exporter TauE/SafE family protein [Pseudomonadota bacterium]